MSLEPISLQKLQLLEFTQFVNRFISNITNQEINIATDTDFKDLYDKFIIEATELEESLKQIKTQSISDILLQLDEVRGKKVITLRRALQLAEYSDDDKEKTAYASLKVIFDAYKDIERANYEAESLGIEKLIAELRKSNNAPAVALLGLEKYILLLENANTNFKEMFDKRASALMNAKVYDTKALRKAVETSYKNIANYILTMAKIKNNAYYSSILVALNNGRKYFADLLAKRNGSN